MSSPAVRSRAERAELLRPVAQELARRLGWRDAAKRLGVSKGAFQNLLNGSTPQADTLRRMEEAVEREGLLGGMAEEGALPADQAAAQSLFEHFEGMVRRTSGEGVAPEELQLRKMDVVEGLGRLYAMAGAVPAWINELKGRIERGEI